jgi:CHAT domain-containing protein
VWDAVCAVCAALTRAGDDRFTLEVHESAIRLIESMWFFHPTEEVRLRAFFADKAALYDGLALCYQRLGATAEAWETLEAAKTRYLSDLIVRRRAAPLETYSQVQDVRWAPVRGASAAAEGATDGAAAGQHQLAGIEAAGIDDRSRVPEPEHRKAFADLLRSPNAPRWRVDFIKALWDGAPAWVASPSGFRLREAFTPLRLSIQDAVRRRRGEPGAVPLTELRHMIESTRDALAEIDFTHKDRVLALGSDYFPGVAAFVEAAPPYNTVETLELEALLEVLNVICGEASPPRTSNDPPARSGDAFQKDASPPSRTRRLHEASQRLDAAWQSVAEPNWRYVTRLARGEPSSFSRLRAMLGYESAHAIVAFHVTARGTVVYLFRGASRIDQLPASDSSHFQSSDTLTFPALTLERVQELVGTGWLDPLQTLELHTNNERIEGPARLRMTETLGQIYTELLGPVVQRLRRWKIRRLTLIPSRGLYALPLHASWYASGGDQRYLAEDYDIAYAPSVTLLDICWTRCENRLPSPVRLYSRAGSSSDLPFAQTEVARVARLFPKSRLPTFAESQRADTATHIHFACHGDYNWEDPLESGLQLAEDQRLRLADLFNDALPLKNASLVVLSACQTGVADPTDLADEYLGLTAGFLFSGARAVISTLWPVNDLATMLLMEQLYRHQLNRKRGTAAALRHAQRSLRKVSAESVCRRLTAELAKLPAADKGSTQEKILRSALLTFSEMPTDKRPFDHPYCWAAFTMNGVFEPA